jgi:hypothetical protein
MDVVAVRGQKFHTFPNLGVLVVRTRLCQNLPNPYGCVNEVLNLAILLVVRRLFLPLPTPVAAPIRVSARSFSAGTNLEMLFLLVDTAHPVAAAFAEWARQASISASRDMFVQVLCPEVFCAAVMRTPDYFSCTCPQLTAQDKLVLPSLQVTE